MGTIVVLFVVLMFFVERKNATDRIVREVPSRLNKEQRTIIKDASDNACLEKGNECEQTESASHGTPSVKVIEFATKKILGKG